MVRTQNIYQYNIMVSAYMILCWKFYEPRGLKLEMSKPEREDEGKFERQRESMEERSRGKERKRERMEERSRGREKGWRKPAHPL